MPKVYLKDYKLSDYTISHINLEIELHEENTFVTSSLSVKKQNKNSKSPLMLSGGNFQLESIMLNGKLLNESDYTIKNNDLILHETPAEDFQLSIVTKLNPRKNKACTGLYESGGLLTTHCEAEGFRHITYYLDRPDVLATYTTKILADKKKYPVLLCNGNLIISGINSINPNYHFAIYQDPVPKPSYLFAMVAGQLALREDYFITRSRKKIALRIYVPEADLYKTKHAMQALKAAMRFDEENYDREYDLEIYNIVGVPEFNAGAMENKGLNIFNNVCLLAHPDMATDANFERINTVVGHEYFHNYRGNRVTVKNWFQLSLKEGFATITEQEFCQFLYQSLTSRIADIIALQSRQFPQDAGPLAHPVMPEDYEEPDNIYTMTTYLKGAELLNMLKSLLGKENFKKGCSIYFAENDGKAANIEDFLFAMEKASNKDLSQFLLWYQQAGTPQLEFEDKYDDETQTYYLTARQTCPPTPGQPDKKPMLIPIAVGLLNKNGHDIALQLQGEEKPQGTTRTLELTQPVQTFIFTGVKEKPVPSLLRNYSAPVKITKSPVSDQDLKFLLKHDSDPINRWFAARTIASQAIMKIISDFKAEKSPQIDPDVMECYRAVLLDPTIEPRLTKELLTFPPVESFFDSVFPVDPELIYRSREFFVNSFVYCCYTELKSAYTTIAKIRVNPAYNTEAASIRYLKNMCLSYLMKADFPEAVEYCSLQLQSAKNMTDTLGALSPLAIYQNNNRIKLRQDELDKFSQKWQRDEIAIQHLFKLYALSEAPDALDQIKKLVKSPLFKKEHPDHTWSLLRCFYTSNPLRFHDESGQAYKFIADCLIELDKINPSTAASLAPAFVDWKNLEPMRQSRMLKQLFRLYDMPDLSIAVKEIINKGVEGALVMRKSIEQDNVHTFFQRSKNEREVKDEITSNDCDFSISSR